MSKHTLQVEYDFDFVLIGISSHEKDYRICWALNNKLGFKLTKTNSLEIKGKKQETPSYFSLYSFDHSEAFTEYNVIANISENKLAVIKQHNLFNNKELKQEYVETEFLLPEQKQMDYLFTIKGEITELEIKKIINDIKEIDILLTAVRIDVASLKSKHNLIF
ncbi:MAG: IPExxxVDY family protein [Bacteroidia bacterium]